jgi:hypothetical protein
MGILRLALVSIAAVLLVGCGSGPATTTAGGAKDLTKTFDPAKAKPGGDAAGAQAKASTAQLGPGAFDGDSQMGTKAKPGSGN